MFQVSSNQLVQDSRGEGENTLCWWISYFRYALGSLSGVPFKSYHTTSTKRFISILVSPLNDQKGNPIKRSQNFDPNIKRDTRKSRMHSYQLLIIRLFFQLPHWAKTNCDKSAYQQIPVLMNPVMGMEPTPF